MAAASQRSSTSPTSGDVACPDPSVHVPTPGQYSTASKAALHVTGSGQTSDRASTQSEISALGPDGKLSAAGAATSLKYAKAHDLPSYPTVGIDTASSGNKAANLAASNPRSVELWQPELSSSAGKAALLAHRDGGKLNLWEPQASAPGFSAAGIAMGKQHGLSPQLDYGYTENGKKNSLLAATKSVSGRSSAAPSPAPVKLYPDAENSGFNALNAATVAHRPSTKVAEPERYQAALEASRIKHAQNISREMYTEQPPVDIEVDEKRRQDAMRASAVSMAKQMYDVQQRRSEDSAVSAGQLAARQVHNDAQARPASVNDDVKAQAMQYINLQEAAQKLAAERLAKLDPDGVLAYREHYGYPTTSPRSKLSIRGRKQKSASEPEESDSDDQEQAEVIRGRTGRLTSQVASLDNQKRKQDRSDLLAAAERLVHKRMHDIDEKVFHETGKASPALMEEWETKAREKAAANSEARMENYGKVHIGGGRYMDQSDIDAIASGRMKPTLDEIHDTAEKKRAYDEEMRLEQERLKSENATEKERQREVKAELQRQKDMEREEARKEKEAQKAAKAEAKQQKELERRMEKEEQRQMKEARKETEMKWRVEQEEAAKEPVEKSEGDKPTLPEISADTSANVVLGDRPATGHSFENEPVGVVIPGPGPTAEGVEEIHTQEHAAEDAPVAAPAAVATETAGVEAVTPVAATEASSPSGKRSSKFGSIFGKFRRGSKVSAEKPHEKVGPAEGQENAALNDTAMSGGLHSEPAVPGSSKAEGKKRAESPSPVSSIDEGAEKGGVGKSETSNDNFEEARDKFDEDVNRHSIASEASANRTSSRFQEEL